MPEPEMPVTTVRVSRGMVHIHVFQVVLPGSLDKYFIVHGYPLSFLRLRPEPAVIVALPQLFDLIPQVWRRIQIPAFWQLPAYPAPAFEWSAPARCLVIFFQAVFAGSATVPASPEISMTSRTLLYDGLGHDAVLSVITPCWMARRRSVSSNGPRAWRG